MASLKGLSRLLRAGLITSIALMSLGLVLGSRTLASAGLISLALTPVAGLVYASILLAREGGLIYAIIALLDAAIIVSVMLYLSLT